LKTYKYRFTDYKLSTAAGFTDFAFFCVNELNIQQSQRVQQEQLYTPAGAQLAGGAEVRQPPVPVSKGRQNGKQDRYFEWKTLICLHTTDVEFYI
jgi:hypothetical protein